MSSKERAVSHQGKKSNRKKSQEIINTLNTIQSNSNNTIKWTKNYMIRLQL